MLELSDPSSPAEEAVAMTGVNGGSSSPATKGRGLSSRIASMKALARENKQQLYVTIAYCFAFIGFGISVTGFGPTLLELVDLTHTSKKQMGYIFTVKGFGYFLGSLTGRVYDRLDGHKILFGSILFSAVLFFAVPFVSTIWGQGIVWFIIGIGTGGVDTGANTLIVWLWKEKVNPFMQLLHFSFGLGAFMSPMVVAALQTHSLFSQYAALAIPFGLSAIPVVFFPSPTNKTISEVELTSVSDTKVDEVVHESTEGLLSEQDTAPVAAPESVNADAVSEQSKRLRIEVVFFASMLLLLDVGAEIGFGGWIFTYAKNELNFSDPDAAFVNAAFWGAFTGGRLAAVPLSLFLSQKTMLFSDIFGCSLSLVILFLFPKSSAVLWFCSILFGVSIASVFPTVISLPQNLGVKVTGTDTSWMVVGASAGEMLVPLMVGALQEYFSMRVMVIVVLIVEILGACMFMTLLLRVKCLSATMPKQGGFVKLNEES